MYGKEFKSHWTTVIRECMGEMNVGKERRED